MKSVRIAYFLTGAVLSAVGLPGPGIGQDKTYPAAQVAQVGRPNDPVGQRRDEIRKPQADRPRGDNYGAKPSSETPRRENEALRRLRLPNEYEKRQESPLERQRRESYEAQKQPEPQREKKRLSLSGCADGYVRREAFASDQVCVTPETHAQVLRDNIQAPSRRNPTGPNGLDSCIDGYVWREAFPGDRVCVTPETRALTQRDNSEAVHRTAR